MVTRNERRLYRKASEKPPRAKATWDFPLVSVKVGTYRLLNGVEECTGVTYSEYHPEGMCVLLQKIS